MTNETHDPALASWLNSANEPGCDFPIQNLPFAIFRKAGREEAWRAGVAIGHAIVDLAQVHARGLFSAEADEAAAACSAATLNTFMAMGPRHWHALRLALSRALRQGGDESLRSCLIPQDEAEYNLPTHIGDYTDFYASIHHATRVGRLFRPDQPLLPNYKWLPIAYHGRASSILISGHPIQRPLGQRMPPGGHQPVLSPTARLDYELELGIFIGSGNALGQPISLDEAEAHVFGLCLLNDWSAREIQGWEYQPLGPFLAKNFATSISQWIVTMEALEPYRLPWTRDPADPQPLAYLDSQTNRAQGSLDIQLEAALQTAAMRQQGRGPQRLSSSSFRHSYWSIAQMVTHHTVNGCNLQAGDLLGSGTQSGPELSEAGCLLELTEGGRKPLLMPNGEQRGFLEDGDTVVFKAWCERPGAARIGFGSLSGTVSPAHSVPADQSV